MSYESDRLKTLKELEDQTFRYIEESLDMLEHIEDEKELLDPDYKSGAIGKRLVGKIADSIFRLACRKEVRFYAHFVHVAWDLESLVSSVEYIPESAERTEVRFGKERACPETGLFALAAREPRVRTAVKAAVKSGDFGHDPRLRDLPEDERSAWKALSRKEKQAANRAAWMAMSGFAEL